MKHKEFILLFFIGSFMVFSILPIFNYINDQWRVLHSDYEKFYQDIEPNKSFLKVKYLLEHKDKFDVLLMGSSRIGNLDSKLFSENAYNMTYSFGHISVHLENLKILLKNDVKIKKIILGIDDFYIFKNPNNFEADYLRKPFKDDLLGKMDFYRFYLLKKPTDRDIDIFNNKYNLFTSLQIINPADINDRINYEKYISDNLTQHEEKLQTPILLDYNENFRTDQVIKEISEFKEVCDLHHIDLITIMFPQFYTVYMSYNQDEIENFKKKLVQVINFHDFYMLSDYTFDIKYWFDTSHFVPSIGEYIIDSVKKNKNLITIGNIDESIKNSKNLISNVFNKELKSILKFNSNINFDSLHLIFNIQDSNYFANNQLEINITDQKINLKVLNKDPIIILNKTKADSNNVVLIYEIDSKIDTIFQLFYKKEKNSNYNEADSYKLTLNKGINKINLLIPSVYINNDLRVDLVSDIGNFEIKKFEIYSK